MLPAYMTMEPIEKMNQYSEDQKSHIASIYTSEYDHHSTKLLLPDEQPTKLACYRQGSIKNERSRITTVAPVHKTPRFRGSASDYGRMEAAAWAVDMYDICGGDGEGNAYLDDGICICI